LRIVVDRERCCGGGQCVLAAPTVFDQDDDGLVLVLKETPEPSEEADVAVAANICPSGCISLVRDDPASKALPVE